MKRFLLGLVLASISTLIHAHDGFLPYSLDGDAINPATGVSEVAKVRFTQLSSDPSAANLPFSCSAANPEKFSASGTAEVAGIAYSISGVCADAGRTAAEIVAKGSSGAVIRIFGSLAHMPSRTQLNGKVSGASPSMMNVELEGGNPTP